MAGRKPERNSEQEIKEAIKEFNKYHSPESHAELVGVVKGGVAVKFSGHYCKSCGFHDYFDDFVFTLSDNGIIVRIDKIDEADDGAVVAFIFEEGR